MATDTAKAPAATAAKSAPKDNSPDVEIPDYLAVDPKVFDSQAGEVFGGTSDILMLDVDEAAGPLTYVGHRSADLGLGDTVVHEAKDKEGKTWRLPISANFGRQIEAGNVERGDTFYVKRIADAEKKRGKGKGQMMQMYIVKVTQRADPQV